MTRVLALVALLISSAQKADAMNASDLFPNLPEEDRGSVEIFFDPECNGSSMTLGFWGVKGDCFTRKIIDAASGSVQTTSSRARCNGDAVVHVYYDGNETCDGQTTREEHKTKGWWKEVTAGKCAFELDYNFDIEKNVMYRMSKPLPSSMTDPVKACADKPPLLEERFWYGTDKASCPAGKGFALQEWNSVSLDGCIDQTYFSGGTGVRGGVKYSVPFPSEYRFADTACKDPTSNRTVPSADWWPRYLKGECVECHSVGDCYRKLSGPPPLKEDGTHVNAPDPVPVKGSILAPKVLPGFLAAIGLCYSVVS